MAQIKMTLVKSLIGRGQKQIDTARSLGLKRINDVTVQPDSPETRGKIAKIEHLINIENAK